jgi:hypothetical protein
MLEHQHPGLCKYGWIVWNNPQLYDQHNVGISEEDPKTYWFNVVLKLSHKFSV